MRFWVSMIGEMLPVRGQKRRLRTALLADTLCSRGHEVTWWSSRFDHDKKQWLPENAQAETPNLHLELARGLGYAHNYSVRRYFDHRLVTRRLLHAARRSGQKPDLILATVPDHNLACGMTRIGVDLGIPVVIDIRDQWPEIFLRPLPASLQPFGRLVLAKDFRRLRWCLQRAYCLTAMMGPLLDWGLAIAGRSRSDDDQVLPLGSKDLPSVGQEALPAEVRDAIRLRPGARVITFAGTFGEFYNPEIIVRAARRFQGSGPQAKDYLFVLAGDGQYVRTVNEAAAGMSNVILPGWLGPEAIAALLRSSHLFIIPCTKPIPAFPNKAFAYLSAGAPIISSVYGELRDIIEQTGIGANFEPGDEEALAAKIEQILGNEEQRCRMGQAARQLYEEKFSSDIIYGEFAGFLENLARNRSARQRELERSTR